MSGLPELSLSSLQSSIDATRQKLADAVEHVHDHVIPHARNEYRPLALHHRALWLMSALLVVVKVAIVVIVSFVPPIPAASSAITVGNILSLTNQSRQQSGIAVLGSNSKLTQAAQKKAEDMVAKQYFSHVAPDGKNPWDFISAAGYSYQAAGENLAVNFLQAEEVNTAWLNSPGHRANILNGTFKEVGIGIATGPYNGNTVTFVVQMFGSPPASAAIAAATPQPDPAPQPTPVSPPQPAPAPAPAPVPAPQPIPVPQAVVQPTPQPASVPAAQPVTKPARQPVPKPSVLSPVVPQPTPPIKFSIRGPNTTGIKDQLTATAAAEITDVITEIKGGTLFLSAAVLGDIAGLSALNGDRSFALIQKDGRWVADVQLSDLIDGAPLTLVGTDKNGNTVLHEVGATATSLLKSFNPETEASSKLVSIFGIPLNFGQFENTFYSLFIASLLFVLMLAIAIRPRIQHLVMIGHTSIVIILAAMLWVNVL